MSLECRMMQVERMQSAQLLLAWRSKPFAFKVMCSTCVLSRVLGNLLGRVQPRVSMTRTSVPRQASFTKYRMPAGELQSQDSSCLTYLSPPPLAPINTHKNHIPGAQMPHPHKTSNLRCHPHVTPTKNGACMLILYTHALINTRPFRSGTSGCQVAPAWLLAQQHRLLRVVPAQQQERISGCTHACAHKALKQSTAAYSRQHRRPTTQQGCEPLRHNM